MCCLWCILYLPVRCSSCLSKQDTLIGGGSLLRLNPFVTGCITSKVTFDKSSSDWASGSLLKTSLKSTPMSSNIHLEEKLLQTTPHSPNNTQRNNHKIGSKDSCRHHTFFIQHLKTLLQPHQWMPSTLHSRHDWYTHPLYVQYEYLCCVLYICQ